MRDVYIDSNGVKYQVYKDFGRFERDYRYYDHLYRYGKKYVNVNNAELDDGRGATLEEIGAQRSWYRGDNKDLPEHSRWRLSRGAGSADESPFGNFTTSTRINAANMSRGYLGMPYGRR